MPKNPESAACYQTAAIMVGAAELAVLLSVFLMPETLGQQRMVSTNLFALMYYKVSITLLTALQLLIVVLFLLRFRLVARVWTGVALALASCALVGWALTVTYDPETDAASHSAGAGIFVAATAGYFAILLNLAYEFDPVGVRRYDLMAYGVMLCAGVFAIVYVVLYFSEPEWSWLFENIAFVLLAAGYVLFFWFHPFDPAEPIAPGQRPVMCQPLLVGQGANMVPDVDAFY